MKAVRLSVPGGPAALELVDLPMPVPQSGEVLVRAHAIGVGRPDVMIRTGKYKWMPPLPAIIGNELCGIVEAVGPDVAASWHGKQVLITARELKSRGGCYAEVVTVPAASAIEVPATINPVSAVTLPNYQLAWALLHETTRGKLPRSVFLNGAAGGVGSALIDLCRHLGITVVAGASTAEKLEFVLKCGAHHAVATPGGGTSIDTFVASILQVTSGGVDAAFDHLGGDTAASLLELLAPFGLLVSYNALLGAPKEDLYNLLRQKGAKGLSISAFNMHAFDSNQEKRRALLHRVVELMAAGHLKPRIFDRMPLSDVRKAHELLDDRSILGKLVLVPDM
jgi:NADPH2:quinone reductase